MVFESVEAQPLQVVRSRERDAARGGPERRGGCAASGWRRCLRRKLAAASI